MPFPAIEIANYFIKKSDYEISPIKVQKLIIIAHGIYLAAYNERLIKEDIKVLPYGAVIKEIFIEFPLYKAIRKLGKCSVEIEESGFLDEIYRVYGKYSGFDLAAMTRRKGSPFYFAKKLGLHSVSDTLMKDYYKEYINYIL